MRTAAARNVGNNNSAYVIYGPYGQQWDIAKGEMR